MDETMLEPARPPRMAVSALAEVAAALADDARRARFEADPSSEVDGFDQLPKPVQETLAGMSVEELRAVGKMNEALVGSGFFVKDDIVFLSMF